MDADSFLLALVHFFSRQGTPAVTYFDKGSYLVAGDDPSQNFSLRTEGATRTKMNQTKLFSKNLLKLD